MPSPTPNKPLVLVAVEAPSELPLGDLAARSAVTRLQLSDYERITAEAILNNQVLRASLRRTKERGGRLHLIGMLAESSGHTSLSHLWAVIDAAIQAGVRVVVHAILDGLDPARRNAAPLIAALETRLGNGVGRIGTVSGRGWTVDSEGRWDRIEKLYRAMLADGVARFDSALVGVQESCAFGKPEGFVTPFVVFDYPGVSLVDSAVHVHSSPGGARELTRALAATSFEPFVRGCSQAPFQGRFTCMVPYDSELGLPTLFARTADPADLPWELLSQAERAHWHADAAATPAMVESTVRAIRTGAYACVEADLASPDNPARSADPKVLRAALAQIADAALSAGGGLLVVGSADALGAVPCAYVSNVASSLRSAARWEDVGPTLLELLQLPADADAEGASLIVK